MTDRRLTLVARDNHKPDMDWNYRGPGHDTAVAFTESTAALRYALGAGTNLGFDICRVIVDRTGSGDDFLELLTELPIEYAGDVLMIRDDGAGVLSATGRGGDRVLYSLTVHDVRFYLEAQNLVTGRVAMELTA
jgi:hypothetical protein